MAVPASVVELVERFERNIDSYKRGNYNETQVRREFVDPLFAALGWDVDNTQGYAEAYKDVIHEDAIKIGSATKAPDYCFRIGGTRKFFLEAKKPSIDIKGDPSPAYQLRRYAWSAKLPLSILTDFEEFAVYDCRMRPAKTDKSSQGRIQYLTYKDYLEKWDDIAAVFSREAVLKGSFDKYAETARGKRGTQEVDAGFLAEIEGWRETLAKNIALRNPALNHRELNFAVQLTIDRIIFLRICEDRGIERYGELLAMINGEAVYDRLLGLFRKADDRYNSGLFHFTTEKGRHDPPDELTPGLVIDDKILKDMFKRMYYPDSPFEFSVLPAEILGQVYEQFLGSTVTLTAGHRARVENKPEVKKAGGVFYTPAYIVDYIVQNTVGKLVEGKTPKQVSKIKILDPACGSGSFLLGAYQFLLDWHLQYYLDNEPQEWAKKKDPPVCAQSSPLCESKKLLPCEGEVAEGRRGLLRLSHTPASQDAASKKLSPCQGGVPRRGEGVLKATQNDVTISSFKLTLTERKRILLDCLYGVDIDSQAVEVTKLSLLLKVLEGEKQLHLFATERALPDLCDNIKCGNSLIGPDFYKNQQLALFDDEMHYKINAFDWQKEFPQIFKTKTPGFDAVIGNPPYIRIQTMKDTQPESVDYFSKKYKSAAKGNYDIYVVFVEMASVLLSREGKLGYILPNKFLTTDYGLPLREYLAESNLLSKIVDFGHEQVFANATIYTCLLFLDYEKHGEMEYTIVKPEQLIYQQPIEVVLHPLKSISAAPWQFFTDAELTIKSKLFNDSIPLIDLPCKISRGSSSGADDVFCLSEKGGCFFTRNGDSVVIEKDILRKPLYATTFSRYNFTDTSDEYIIFPYNVSAESYSAFDEGFFKTTFPLAYQYLRSQKNKLEKRKQYRDWYAYSASRNLNLHDRSDLLIPLLANKGLFSKSPSNIKDYCMMASAGFSICIMNKEYSPYYVLALLNSKLLFWYLKHLSNAFRSGWITCTKQYFGLLPIKKVGSAKGKKALHDTLVSLVEGMLGLHEKLAAARTTDEKTRLQRQIDATDAQIDARVYALYGLTPEEIAIVEATGE